MEQIFFGTLGSNGTFNEIQKATEGTYRNHRIISIWPDTTEVSKSQDNSTVIKYQFISIIH